jgi:hypothetical protein
MPEFNFNVKVASSDAEWAKQTLVNFASIYGRVTSIEAQPDFKQLVQMQPPAKNELIIDAFNLWEGAVIIIADYPDQQYVVTKIYDRVADEEVVVLTIREYETGELTVDNIPHVIPMLLNYSTSVRVIGSIVNPTDVNDQNKGA